MSNNGSRPECEKSGCGLGRVTSLLAAILLFGLLGLEVSLLIAQGDYLTEEEAGRIRTAQELLPRTRAYLAVAGARVGEMGRRMGKTYAITVPELREKEPKKSKKGKESEAQAEPENPLIFFQLSDLALAISQSLSAVMTNVDERFQHKRAAPEEIVKALELLEKFVSQKFSLLEDLEDKARQEDDIALYKAVVTLREDLARARDGAAEGLRALRSGSKQ